MRLVGVCGVLLVLLTLTFVSAACSENPNEHAQSNELFRPAAPETRQQVNLSHAAQQQVDQQRDQQGQLGDQAEVQETQEGAAGESSTFDEQPVQPADDDAQASRGSPDSDQPIQDQGETANPLETTEDVIRRYTNPTFGYSLELICSPFCAPTSNGIDRVMFSSETGRALIGVDVHVDDGSQSESLIRSWFNLGDNIEFSSVEQTSTITGEMAERFNWDEDRRATGGFQVRWHAVLVRAHDLIIALRAGTVIEDYEDVAPALERAIGSLFLPLEIAARPGRYDRFDFVIDYDTADFAQEFGQPTTNPPTDPSGIFVLQTTTALKAVLTWQILGEVFYDGDNAITQSLLDSLGIENASGFRDAVLVDGRPSRTGETETMFGEGALIIQSYAWYCDDGGREFVLHVLDPEDPESIALQLIEGFRCSAASEAESNG